MLTPYLDSEIAQMKAHAKNGILSANGRKKLAEFEAIREALNPKVEAESARPCASCRHAGVPILEEPCHSCYGNYSSHVPK